MCVFFYLSCFLHFAFQRDRCLEYRRVNIQCTLNKFSLYKTIITGTFALIHHCYQNLINNSHVDDTLQYQEDNQATLIKFSVI